MFVFKEPKNQHNFLLSLMYELYKKLLPVDHCGLHGNHTIVSVTPWLPSLWDTAINADQTESLQPIDTVKIYKTDLKNFWTADCWSHRIFF